MPLALATLALSGCGGSADVVQSADIAETADLLGEVSFPISCDPSVQPTFDDAVATLHSFEFAEARAMFEAVASEDPDCAMAYWGIAETHYHPLWAPPSPAELAAGAAAAEKAEGLEKTDREALYVAAIASFYRDYEVASHDERAERYEKAMAEAHEQLPDDPEAEIFHALAMLSNVDPTDKTYVVQKKAGAMLEPLFAEMPSHPGVAHYIIHAYDYPPLAARAKEAAHRYLDIAASLPHALHMSGHIFTQLGMWEDSIEANSRSAEAARVRSGAQAQFNEMHALDYLVYAYLQRGEDEKAKAIVEDIGSRPDLDWTNGVVAYNAGAVPVRWALERHAWEEAAAIPPLEPRVGEGGRSQVRMAVALRHWAAALGAARSGKIEQARAELAEVESMAAELRDAEDVWARSTSEVLRREAAAWVTLAAGDEEKALALMRSAASLEDETDKSGLSPGRVLPAHEMLGDLLMELDRPEEALVAYQTSLEHAPGRYNTFLGAARAAVAAEQAEPAREYYQKLLELTVPDSSRAGVEEAKSHLQSASA